MIVKIENFLSQDKVTYLLDLMNQLPPRSNSSDSETNKRSTVYDDVTYPGGAAVRNETRRKIHDAIFRDQSIVDQVCERVTCGEFDNVFSSIAKYESGDVYDWHLDRLTTGDGRLIDVSYTIFLNDPNEYEGGSLQIKHEYGTASFREKAGTAVFYPSGYLHKVDEIISGERKVVLGLMNCNVSSPQDRHLLTELYGCIRSLDRINDGRVAQINQTLHYVHMQLLKRFFSN